MNAALSPDNYDPRAPADLIGGARQAALLALRDGAKIVKTKRNLKFLIHGDAGNGKSAVANMIARELSANFVDVETIDGPNITAEVVRRWRYDARFASLFGGWKVKLIPETDLVPPAAQDLMLTYLDELPAQTAVIGTSNKNVALLTERFQTRFRLLKIESPSSDELAAWLHRRWRIPKLQANFIALHACGNVRAALLDAADYLTFGEVRERPKIVTSDWREIRAADIRNQRRSARSKVAA